MLNLQRDQRGISLARLEAALPWVRAIAHIYSVLSSALLATTIVSTTCAAVSWLIYPAAVMTNVYVSAIPVAAMIARRASSRRADETYAKARQMLWDSEKLKKQIPGYTSSKEPEVIVSVP